MKRHMVAEMLYAAFTVIAHSLVGAYKAYRVIFYGDALARIITLISEKLSPLQHRHPPNG